MKKFSRMKLFLYVLLILLAVAVFAETLRVKVRMTSLRAEPKFYSASVAVLKAGETVEKISSQNGWYKVKTAKGAVGWIHSSSVESKKFTLLAMDKSLKTGATADEVALAGKGFNKQVEESYKAKHRDADFAAVDQMLKRNVTAEELKDFLKKGKLGEFGGGQ